MGDGMAVGPVLGMRNAGDHFAASAEQASSGGRLDLWGGDEFSFNDLLDLVNPLQHIPIVSNLYRSLTGDQIGAVARIFGGAVLGGPIGAVSAVINSALDSSTGKDAGEHILALLNGEESFGGGEAPLLAAMGDRSGEEWPGAAVGTASGSEGDPVQTATAGDTLEIDGLPWLRAALDGDDGEPGPIQAASAAPAVREIAVDAPLPWLAAAAGPVPALAPALGVLPASVPGAGG
ncbi:MAG: hypothetical protein HOK81_15615, partial [Rhodospirillaceae bacterium]|nr:hypothetical protein [Rhodospirillaceae bacterium]